jgi:hypothetical protein
VANKLSRNDPCPCGSGKKYKRCHAGQPDDPYRKDLPVGMTDEVTAEAPPLPSWTRFIPWGIGAVGGLAAGAAWAAQGASGAFAVLAGTGLFLAGWFTFSKPPSRRDNQGDPAGLNFGRKE